MAFPKSRAIPFALLLCATFAPAQTLAKKNWAGSGMTIAPWWQSPVLYVVDPVSFQDSNGDGFGDLNGILQRLDYLQTLNVDALVLSPLQTSAASSGQPFDPVYGAPDDLDQLITEATRRKIRIFVDLPLTGARNTAETINLARFWLSRGVAGLRLTLPANDPISASQLPDRLRELRKLCASYPGDRVLFWDAPQPAPTETLRHSRAPESTLPDPIQLSLDPALELLNSLDAATLRRALATLPQPTLSHTIVLASDSADRPRSFDRSGDNPHDLELARILAAALLTSPGAPLLYFGQELGMQTTPAHSEKGNPTPMQWGDARGFTDGVPWIDMGRNTSTANVAVEDTDRYSLLNWYRRLTALHHASAALREGAFDLLNLADPSVVAWVRHPRVTAAGSQPTAAAGANAVAANSVLVLCNLSDRPAVLGIASELRRLKINPGSGVLHTLATSEMPATASAAGPETEAPVSINSIKIPPYGVYLGELRRQAGLESAPSPGRSRRSTSGPSTRGR